MEVAMELEDDVFFADLSKQISLLIMDDDGNGSSARYPSASLQVRIDELHQAFSHSTALPSDFGYEQTCIRESKGTGVFIPQSLVPRRKRRSGRLGSINTNSYRPSDKSRVSHGNISCNYCNPRVKET